MEAMPKTVKWFQKGALEGGEHHRRRHSLPGGDRHHAAVLPGRVRRSSPGATRTTTWCPTTRRSTRSSSTSRTPSRRTWAGRGPNYFRGHIGRYLSCEHLAQPAPLRPLGAQPGALPAADRRERAGSAQGRVDRASRQYSTTYFKQQALQFLSEADQGGQTFFMHLGTYAPHAPYDADTPYNEANYPQSNFPSYTQTPAQQETDLSDKPPVGAGVELRGHLRHQPGGPAPEAAAHAEVRRRPRRRGVHAARGSRATRTTRSRSSPPTTATTGTTTASRRRASPTSPASRSRSSCGGPRTRRCAATSATTAWSPTSTSPRP